MISLEPLRRALASLNAALEPPPRNDRERDGAIQRFEYTFELAWKTSMRVLREEGLDAGSPKTVIRELARLGWIEDAESWIEFLDARNATSHVYNEAIARRVFDAAVKFTDPCGRLLDQLGAVAP